MAQAQEMKNFTLADVIPGGKTYSKMTPATVHGLGWWGNVCVKKTKNTIEEISLKDGSEKTLVRLEEVNLALQQKDTTYRVASLMSASFPKPHQLMFALGKGRYAVYDAAQKALVSTIRTNAKAQNHDFCMENGRMAYTVGQDLFVTTPDDKSVQISPVSQEKGVVYGQSVHQHEFGIRKGTFWSPKGNYLAFYRMDESMVSEYPQVNTAARMAAHEPQHYPMAGTKNHKVTVGIYNVKTGAIHYLQAGDPEDRFFTNIAWSPDETSVYMVEVARRQNHAKLIRYEVATGRPAEVIYEEKHPKYVEPQFPIEFLPWDDTQFIYRSQRDGYHHIYLFDLKRPVKGEWTSAPQGEYWAKYKVTPLTSGDWLVKDVFGFNAKKKTILFASTEVSPLQTNIYEVTLKGKRTPLDNGRGTHFVQFNEQGDWLIDNYTAHDVPRNITVRKADKAEGITLLDAKDPLVEKCAMPEITLGTIKAADGKTDLYYRLIKPLGFDPNKKYPAVIYVYGGPHTQLITDTRFYGARGWDIYMATQGYVMLTVDNRGSSNRGLEFENAIYRQVGTEEMRDQMEGVKLLKSLGYVDGERIGVHGWSYGGFMTTNLMLTYPDVFKVGVAGGPVIDWNFYEIMYGERYMDTPQENPEGYKKNNLNLRAGDLKGRLQIIIGGMDPVCLPQHSYTFLRACIDAGTQPDFFVYPESGHNMIGPERVHLYERITRYFKDYLK